MHVIRDHTPMENLLDLCGIEEILQRSAADILVSRALSKFYLTGPYRSILKNRLD